MLAEPREALLRSSTFRVTAGRAGLLDLTTIYEGKPERLYTRAIYALQLDELTYCVAPPRQPRPAAFATQQGDGLTLVSLRRASAKEILLEYGVAEPYGDGTLERKREFRIEIVPPDW